jgi:hypothetical protein
MMTLTLDLRANPLLEGEGTGEFDIDAVAAYNQGYLARAHELGAQMVMCARPLSSHPFY